MKTILLIIMALAILLYPFRRHFDKPAKIKELIKQHPLLLTRFVYLVLAILWVYINTNNIILSQRDALRIGVPVLWYTIVPALLLLLYAIFPLNKVWILPAANLILGWGMHMQKTIVYCYQDMDFKTDLFNSIIGFTMLITISTLYVLACISMMYLTGPYIIKYLRRNKI